MSRERANGRKELLWQMLCILLLTALLAMMLTLEAVRIGRTVSREQAVVATYTHTDTLSGYLFRNELALQSANNGPVAYAVAEGETLRAGDVVASVYVDDTGSDKRERAATLFAELARCERALSAQESAWQGDYVYGYAALMRELSTGTLQNAAGDVSALANTLARANATEEETANALRARADAIRAELSELVEHVDTPEVLTTALDGRFYQQADGYEATFGLGAIDSLTPERLQALLDAPQSTDNAVGKIVADGTWYLALPVSVALADTYQSGASYTVRLARDVRASLVLERIALSESGEHALLILRGDGAPHPDGSCRRVQLTIEKESLEGIRIPAAALYDGDTVFVEENGVARAKKVTTLVQKNGCVLITPDAELSQLKVGEYVLLSTRKIYDGKAVN